MSCTLGRFFYNFPGNSHGQPRLKTTPIGGMQPKSLMHLFSLHIGGRKWEQLSLGLKRISPGSFGSGSKSQLLSLDSFIMWAKFTSLNFRLLNCKMETQSVHDDEVQCDYVRA